MALQVVSPAVSVFKVTGVKDGVEQTEEYTYKRGELLPSWVTPYQQFVLSQTGMARQVGDFPDPNLRRPEDIPAPVILPEHDVRTVVGTDVIGSEVIRRVTDPAAVEVDGSAGEPVAPGELPADAAPKPVWEDFAVTQFDMPRGKAEGMKKADLVREAKALHAERAGAEAGQ